jgi:hypothetical protein
VSDTEAFEPTVTNLSLGSCVQRFLCMRGQKSTHVPKKVGTSAKASQKWPRDRSSSSSDICLCPIQNSVGINAGSYLFVDGKICNQVALAQNSRWVGRVCIEWTLSRKFSTIRSEFIEPKPANTPPGKRARAYRIDSRVSCAFLVYMPPPLPRRSV